MELSQTLTLADQILLDFQRKSERVSQIKKRFDARCAIMDNEVLRELNRGRRAVERQQKAKHFCSLSLEDQREFLKRYGEDDVHKEE